MTPNHDATPDFAAAALILPAVAAADTGDAAVDVRDYQAATIALTIGAGGIVFTGANRIDFVLTHSDDGQTFVPVGADDVVTDALAPATIENGIVRSLRAAHAAPTVQRIGYVGGRAFVRLIADFSGAHGTGTPIAATIVRSLAALRGAD